MPVRHSDHVLGHLQERRRMPWLTFVGAALLTLVSLTGCAGRGSIENDAVSTTAASFLHSAAPEPEQACDLLAPATLENLERDGEVCTEVVPDVGVPPMSADVFDVEVYGRDAMFRSGDATVFLARFDDGWRITAAGCTPRGKGLPYECSIEAR